MAHGIHVDHPPAAPRLGHEARGGVTRLGHRHERDGSQRPYPRQMANEGLRDDLYSLAVAEAANAI